jgi:hypothetical protein
MISATVVIDADNPLGVYASAGVVWVTIGMLICDRIGRRKLLRKSRFNTVRITADRICIFSDRVHRTRFNAPRRSSPTVEVS